MLYTNGYWAAEQLANITQMDIVSRLISHSESGLISELH